MEKAPAFWSRNTQEFGLFAFIVTKFKLATTCSMFVKLGLQWLPPSGAGTHRNLGFPPQLPEKCRPSYPHTTTSLNQANTASNTPCWNLNAFLNSSFAEAEISFRIRWSKNYSRLQPLPGYQYLPNLQIHCRINGTQHSPLTLYCATLQQRTFM